MGHTQHEYKTVTFYSELLGQLLHAVFHHITSRILFNMPLIESFVWIDSSITIAWAGFSVNKNPENPPRTWDDLLLFY